MKPVLYQGNCWSCASVEAFTDDPMNPTNEIVHEAGCRHIADLRTKYKVAP